VVVHPSPMWEVRGLSPVRDEDFRVRMRCLNYFGLVTLTSFGWDDKSEVQCVYAFRTSSTHCKDPAVSVCKSQDCGNIQKPSMHSVSCLMRCKYSQDWLLATNNPDPDHDVDTLCSMDQAFVKTNQSEIICIRIVGYIPLKG
jgi:hypothetical protein